ncbi:hypothetical protein SmJEL517_g03510 [Synchytrium microbalum]|uniref:Enoyl reductase (ER) domain-containing protein n=1 Tax=Synchytrium microbalum TaxID=1806994 RepID=A0A507C2I1_9FUNG|nr:uncharacterized protein SmJEL517_g03510 [Synchytrium microbalum]TPX33631.1 hypothetical protein SmJEL517_g03510 [Synchytrium microbalum]
MPANTDVILVARPVGMPDIKKIFQVRKGQTMPKVEDGQVLLRTLQLSLDPAMRGWIRDDQQSYVAPVPLQGVMRGDTVCVVEESKHKNFKKGDIIHFGVGWTEYAIVSGDALRGSFGDLLIPSPIPKGIQVSDYISILGLTGLTAMAGVFDVGKAATPGLLTSKSTCVVSGAAGATGKCQSLWCFKSFYLIVSSYSGMVAAQLYKHILGCRVVGICSSDKLDFLLKELKLDAAVDYKSPNFAEELKAACPNGVDEYFDNVEGIVTEAVFENMAKYCRVVSCGGISNYNDPSNVTGPRNYRLIRTKNATICGFIVTNYAQKFKEYQANLINQPPQPSAAPNKIAVASAIPGSSGNGNQRNNYYKQPSPSNKPFASPPASLSPQQSLGVPEINAPLPSIQPSSIASQQAHLPSQQSSVPDYGVKLGIPQTSIPVGALSQPSFSPSPYISALPSPVMSPRDGFAAMPSADPSPDTATQGQQHDLNPEHLRDKNKYKPTPSADPVKVVAPPTPPTIPVATSPPGATVVPSPVVEPSPDPSVGIKNLASPIAEPPAAADAMPPMITGPAFLAAATRTRLVSATGGPYVASLPQNAASDNSNSKTVLGLSTTNVVLLGLGAAVLSVLILLVVVWQRSKVVKRNSIFPVYLAKDTKPQPRPSAMSLKPPARSRFTLPFITNRSKESPAVAIVRDSPRPGRQADSVLRKTFATDDLPVNEGLLPFDEESGGETTYQVYAQDSIRARGIVNDKSVKSDNQPQPEVSEPGETQDPEKPSSWWHHVRGAHQSQSTNSSLSQYFVGVPSVLSSQSDGRLTRKFGVAARSSASVPSSDRQHRASGRTTRTVSSLTSKTGSSRISGVSEASTSESLSRYL